MPVHFEDMRGPKLDCECNFCRGAVAFGIDIESLADVDWSEMPDLLPLACAGCEHFRCSRVYAECALLKIDVLGDIYITSCDFRRPKGRARVAGRP